MTRKGLNKRVTEDKGEVHAETEGRDCEAKGIVGTKVLR
jgi:hypothetical protein